MSYNSLHKLVPCFSFSGAVTARCHCLTRADFCNIILGHFLGSRVRMVRKVEQNSYMLVLSWTCKSDS